MNIWEGKIDNKKHEYIVLTDDNGKTKLVNETVYKFMNMGILAYERGDFKSAINHFTSAINDDNSMWYPLNQRGDSYLRIGEYDKALRDFFKSKELSNNYLNNQSIARCYEFKGEYSTAIKYFDIAVAQLGLFEENVSWLKENEGFDIGVVKALNLCSQAACFLKIDKPTDAISATTKGIEADDANSNNYGIRGLAFLSLGNFEQGIEDLKEALSREGNMLFEQTLYKAEAEFYGYDLQAYKQLRGLR